MTYRRMTRMISFRVSPHEFEQLRAKSQAEGARSVSDYARLALSREAGDAKALLDHIQRLSADVRRLTELLQHASSRREAGSSSPQPVAADNGWSVS